MYDLVQASIACKLKHFHVVQAFAEGKKDCMDFLGYKETKVTGFRLRRYPDRIASDSLVGTLRMLESMGLQREHLPHCLGGSYDYCQYNEWIRERISIEDIMSFAPLNSTSNRLSIVPTDRVDAPIRRQRTPARWSSNNNKNDNSNERSDETKSEALEMTRKRNALKSRRSYHRRQLELFSLNEQVRVWTLRNAALRQEETRLHCLLAMVHACIPSVPEQQQGTSKDR